jgi:hypothetical protein
MLGGYKLTIACFLPQALSPLIVTIEVLLGQSWRLAREDKIPAARASFFDRL